MTSNMSGRIWCGPPLENMLQEISQWPSLGHYLFAKLDGDNADRIVITDYKSSRQWTGRQLRDKIMDVACALVDKYNLEPDTAVFLNYFNSDYMLILNLALILCGALVACPTNNDTYSELLYVAELVEPKFLFCQTKNMLWAEYLTRDLGFKVEGVDLESKAFDEMFSYDHKSSKSVDHLPVKCSDLKTRVVFITMSSGTTGVPKAVPVTHWNAISDLMIMQGGLARDTTLGCTTSLDYVSGRIIMLGAIITGFNAVIFDGFEVKSYLEALQIYKFDVIYASAACVYKLITYEHLNQYDLSSVRMIVPFGSRMIYLDELRQFLTKHPHIVRIRQAYGASEFSGGARNTMTPDEYFLNCNNCGNLLPGVCAKIVDQETGALLGPNEQGMLHIKSEAVFPGYYDIRKSRRNTKRREDSNESCQNAVTSSPFVGGSDIFDEDGFYITGDLAYFNQIDQLYIVGRQYEMMNCRGGRKVLPHELEVLLDQHPAVAKSCIIGVPNKQQLTVHCPRAFVCVKQNYYTDEIDSLELGEAIDPLTEELSENLSKVVLEHTGIHKLSSLTVERRYLLAENLMNFVNTRVAWEKQLTGGIVFLDELPSTHTGKVNKTHLRSLDLSQIEIYGDQSSCFE